MEALPARAQGEEGSGCRRNLLHSSEEIGGTVSTVQHEGHALRAFRTSSPHSFYRTMVIHAVLDYAHVLAGRALERGGVAVDATVGNGHDTVFLAQTVGPQGRIFGFDVQAEALDRTQERLEEHTFETEVHLLHAGHEDMLLHLPEPLHREVGAIMFNLGYLPGGDHTLTTQPETTRNALEVATRVLKPGGVVTVVQYTGHEGGTREAEAVTEWATSLPQDTFEVLFYQFLNHRNDPPRLLAIEKHSQIE